MLGELISNCVFACETTAVLLCMFVESTDCQLNRQRDEKIKALERAKKEREAAKKKAEQELRQRQIEMRKVSFDHGAKTG